MCGTCRHVMPNGLRCQSPAMRGSAFCYHHGRRIPPARKGSPAEHRVEIPATLDRSGTVSALSSVLQGLADGRISARRASILLWGLRTAADQAIDHVDPPPSPGGPASNPLSGELFALLDPDDDETIALVNALGAKFNLDSPAAQSPRASTRPAT